MVWNRKCLFHRKFRLPKFENRSCVTVFGSCSATLTVGEPLGDVSGSANHDFRTSVTGISGEIDASYGIISKALRYSIRV